MKSPIKAGLLGAMVQLTWIILVFSLGSHNLSEIPYTILLFASMAAGSYLAAKLSPSHKLWVGIAAGVPFIIYFLVATQIYIVSIGQTQIMISLLLLGVAAIGAALGSLKSNH